MKGMFVQWELVYSFSLRDVTGPKNFSGHGLELTLVPKGRVAQVAWDDGSPLSRETAEVCDMGTPGMCRPIPI